MYNVMFQLEESEIMFETLAQQMLGNGQYFDSYSSFI